MILIITGVAGAGKTTIGKILAKKLGWKFYDADDFHPQSNIDKMRRGISLNDEDRRPWLEALHRLIVEQKSPAVIACSALKQSYRDYLKKGRKDVKVVFLKGDKALIRERLEERAGHYAKADLLEGQFEALEEPEDALTEDVSRGSEAIADDIIRELKLS